MERFDNRPCNRKAVERTRTTADFIEQHKAVRSRIAQDVRRFNHLDHERTEATAQAITRAHTRKDSIDNANACTFGRHKAANLRHKHNQAGLAQVRRFTGHVRASDKHEACRIRRERHIVRDKIQIRIHRDNHRMESAANFDSRPFKDFRADVIEFASGSRKAVQAIDTGNRIGNALEFRTPAVHAFADFTENLVFQRMDVDFGIADDGFAFLHLRRDVTFAVHRRLLADILVRNRLRGLGHLRLRDFDVVTEHAVVTDFERGDSQTFAFTAFQGSNPFAAFLDVLVHRIEFRIGTRTNHSAFAHRHRQIIVEILEQVFATASRAIERFAQAFEERRMQAIQNIGDL